ncbi:ATP-binding protein [Fusibacter sp. JL216-2]|uniref:ATP-binding protein n=1 Tax=Fusibacter sp. JL216-2 TaxID=3071453 RepID=UPI003D3512B0
MRRIHKLQPNISNKIAAGEVVERPAAVVKELVENAIDAGASKITIEIKKAGKALIRVTDNGGGIDAEDVDLAFERHATSKIETVDDIYKVATLGFRGRPLPVSVRFQIWML